MDKAVDDFGAGQKWTPQQIRKAKRICYRTVWTECHWRNYANKKVPESIKILPNDGFPSHGGDLDSSGLYQQRQQYYPVERAMVPYEATLMFLKEMLVYAKGWFVQDEAVTCQQTQRSQFDGLRINPATGKPYPYAANYMAEQKSTDALDADLLYFTHMSA